MHSGTFGMGTTICLRFSAGVTFHFTNNSSNIYFSCSISVPKKVATKEQISDCVSSVVVSCSIVQFTVMFDHTICQMLC